MANEKRLIDANALLAELDKFINPMPDKDGLHFLCGITTAITEIENAPTVDAVEIPDCKKCAFNNGIAYWHQCEGCFGNARNNFVSLEEVMKNEKENFC